MRFPLTLQYEGKKSNRCTNIEVHKTLSCLQFYKSRYAIMVPGPIPVLPCQYVGTLSAEADLAYQVSVYPLHCVLILNQHNIVHPVQPNLAQYGIPHYKLCLYIEWRYYLNYTKQGSPSWYQTLCWYNVDMPSTARQRDAKVNMDIIVQAKPKEMVLELTKRSFLFLQCHTLGNKFEVFHQMSWTDYINKHPR